jgi:hypothetical protein
MSIATENRIRALEERISALEAARPRPAETLLEDKVQKLADKVQGIVMRMGKRD